MPAQRQAEGRATPRRCTRSTTTIASRRLFATDEYRLLGGTSWLWANERFRDSVDVLFIDEAGQMSLADVLAVSAGAQEPRAARRPAAARAAAASEPSAGRGGIGARAPARRREDHRERPRPVPASNAPPASRDLQVHGRGLLRESADVVRPGSSGKPCWHPRARRPQPSAAPASCTCPVEHDAQPVARDAKRSRRSRRSSRR